jgi:hypothetical protein
MKTEVYKNEIIISGNDTSKKLIIHYSDANHCDTFSIGILSRNSLISYKNIEFNHYGAFEVPKMERII